MYTDSAIKPHPFGIVLNIHNNSSLLHIDKKIYEPIDPILYAILILPKSSINLIDEKYHDLIDCHKILHEEECCSKCKKYETKIKNIKKNIKLDSDKSELQDLARKFSDRRSDDRSTNRNYDRGDDRSNNRNYDRGDNRSNNRNYDRSDERSTNRNYNRSDDRSDNRSNNKTTTSSSSTMNWRKK
jgi:hypothetical protein